MRKYQQITLRDFKGLNTVDDPATLEDNELSRCINFDITARGTLRKRSGAQRVGNNYATGSYIGGMRLLGRHRTGTADKIYFTDGAKLWRANTTDFGALEEVTYLAASISDASWGFQSRDNFQITQFGGMNLGVAMGSAAAIPGNGPEGTFALAYKTRMWVINTLDTTGLEYRLYYSALGVYDTWTTSTDFIDVGYGDGTPIVAMAVLADTLYIFKSESVWSLQADGSPSNWVLRQVNPTVGCVGRGTVQIIDGMIYFLSRTGVYRTDGTTFEEVSATIRNRFTDRSFGEREDLLKPDAGYYDGKYIVFPKYPTVVDSSLDPTVGYAYHIARDAWTQYSLAIPSAYFGGDNDSPAPDGFVTVSEYDTEFLYFGTTTVSLIFRFRADNTQFTDWGREIEVSRRPYDGGVLDFGENDQGFATVFPNLAAMAFTVTGDAELRYDISNTRSLQSNGIRLGCSPNGTSPSAEVTRVLGSMLDFHDDFSDHDITLNYSYDDGVPVGIGHELVVELRSNDYLSTGDYLRFGFFYTLGDIRIGVRQSDGGSPYGSFFSSARVDGNSEWIRLYWNYNTSTLQLYHGPYEGEYDDPINVAHYPSWQYASSVRIYTRRAASAPTTNFYVHRLGGDLAYNPYNNGFFYASYSTKQYDFNAPGEYKNHMFSLLDISEICEEGRGLPQFYGTIRSNADGNYVSNYTSTDYTNYTYIGLQDYTNPNTPRTRHTLHGRGLGVTRILQDEFDVQSNTPVEVFSHTIAYTPRSQVNDGY